MIREFYYLIALILLPSALLAQTSQFDYPVAAQARTTAFTPAVARYFSPATNGLDTLYQDLNTWDNNLLSNSTREQYNNGVWNPQSRHFYSYDSNGWEIKDSVQAWNGSAWNDNTQSITSYDNFGNVLTSTQLFKNGNNWDTLLSIAYDYTYHFTNEWEEQVTNVWQNGIGFTPSSRITNVFNSFTNEIETINFESGNGTTWMLTGQFTAIVWYDFPARLFTSNFFQAFSNGVPQTMSRQTFDYTDAFNFVQFIEQQNGSAYDTISRTVNEADASDNRTLIEQFSYNSSPPALTFGEKYIHTYDGANQLTETISQEYNIGNGNYESIGVVQYSFGPVGRPEPSASDIDAILFPNPAITKVDLFIKSERPGLYSIEIYSLDGSLIRSSSHRPSIGEQEIAIPLDGIAPGIYHVRITDGSNTARKKLVVQ